MATYAENIPGAPLLNGVVGSTAYGLATADSDIDVLGVFARPTMDLVGLSYPRETYTNPEGYVPDYTYHEARKYVNLALKCNPTIMELLWLGNWFVREPLGQQLINIRQSFIFEKGVRNAYLGYASGQFHRIRSRGDLSFSSDTRHRTAKHARHLWRLCKQGVDLHHIGQLTIWLEAEQARQCREFGERIAGGRLDLATGLLSWAEDEFNKPGILVSTPRTDRAEEWLREVRAQN